MTDRETELRITAEMVLSRWAAYRLYPDQNYSGLCDVMRRLETALEAYDPPTEDEP